MIVWLASYPRAGNTLLRTVLKETMGLWSTSVYDTGPANPYPPEWSDAPRIIGSEWVRIRWEEFYPDARSSSDIHLVKTHDLPIDDSPAIYVVRDGRKAYVSYMHFDREFRDGQASLAGLIAGADSCGDWSSHYRAWSGRPRTLTVRYEQLVTASSDVLQAIAETVGYSGPVGPWINPFERLHKEDSRFFREGNVEWQGDPEWTPQIDGLFFSLHGELMRELGYVDAGQADRSPPSKELLDLANAVRSLKRTVNERLSLIQRQSAECDLLKKAADDRLTIIQKLSDECDLLRRAADERLAVIERLVGSA